MRKSASWLILVVMAVALALFIGLGESRAQDKTGQLTEKEKLSLDIFNLQEDNLSLTNKMNAKRKEYQDLRESIKKEADYKLKAVKSDRLLDLEKEVIALNDIVLKKKELIDAAREKRDALVEKELKEKEQKK